MKNVTTETKVVAGLAAYTAATAAIWISMFYLIRGAYRMITT